MAKYKLEAVVFLCGAVVMIMELAASRIMAPYLGTSIYVWTSIIGIILGCLSLGYWWGGRLADKRPTHKSFSFVILLAAVSIGVVIYVKFPVLVLVQNTIGDIRIGSVVSTLILFSVPSVLLGMVSPYAVRLKIDDVEHSGATVGQLYAISTVGSIVGTFLAGFFLIAYMGSTNILILISIVLVATAALAYPFKGEKRRVEASLILVFALAAAYFYNTQQAQAGFVDIDTDYARIQITDLEDPKTKRPIRMMRSDPFGAQSAMYLDDPDELYVGYTKFYRLGAHFKPNPKRALVIGGGALSYPRDFLRHHPDAQVDVIEIDAMLTELAKKYFAYKEDPRVRLFHEDGRTFLNRLTAGLDDPKADVMLAEQYDIIYVDVFKETFSPPFQLATLEAIVKMQALLHQDGVLLMNVESSLEGVTSKFLNAEVATFKKYFPQVYLFAVQDPSDRARVQNVMLVAMKSEQEPSFLSENIELQGYLERRVEASGEYAEVLTDEYGPAEHLMLDILKQKLQG